MQASESGRIVKEGNLGGSTANRQKKAVNVPRRAKRPKVTRTRFGDDFRLLREFAMQHAEASEVFAAIN